MEKRKPFWLEGRPMHEPAGWFVYEDDRFVRIIRNNDVKTLPILARIGLEREGWDSPPEAA